MCIAIYSMKGNPVPSDDTLKICFHNNSDGAGFAFNTDDRQVQIVKGFMDWDSFIDAFHQYSKQYDFTSKGVLIHFRIATHGQISPACCHPFPISAKEKVLKKTKTTAPYAAIHNGIIMLTASKNNTMSDTMLFIQKYLTKLSSNKGWFDNPQNMELIYNLIDSKMAILNGEGDIRATQGFEKGSDGNYYSNQSYLPTYSLYDFGFYEDWFGFDLEDDFLECPLMELHKDEIVYYEDGSTEPYDPDYHGYSPLYLTKEGDVYACFEGHISGNKIPMSKLTYMGKGGIVNKHAPLGEKGIHLTEFRKDVVGYI